MIPPSLARLIEQWRKDAASIQAENDREDYSTCADELSAALQSMTAEEPQGDYPAVLKLAETALHESAKAVCNLVMKHPTVERHASRLDRDLLEQQIFNSMKAALSFGCPGVEISAHPPLVAAKEIEGETGTEMPWLQVIACKFPDFDSAWPTDKQLKWFDDFRALLHIPAAPSALPSAAIDALQKIEELSGIALADVVKGPDEDGDHWCGMCDAMLEDELSGHKATCASHMLRDIFDLASRQHSSEHAGEQGWVRELKEALVPVFEAADFGSREQSPPGYWDSDIERAQALLAAAPDSAGGKK